MHRRVYSIVRVALLIASAHATPALAQSPELTGLARAASDKHLLTCVRVVLEDSAGHDVASTRTDGRGLFAVAAPGAGTFRLRFELPVAAQVHAPADTLAAGAYSERVYELAFVAPDTNDPKCPKPGPDDVRIKDMHQQPRYPASLRAANIEGDVVAELVIDSTGAVDPVSIRIVRQSNPEFGHAVTEALPTMTFYPQRDHGTAVCQRMIQPFDFRLTW